MSAPSSSSSSSSGGFTRKIPPRDDSAIASEHVFIPLDETAKKLEEKVFDEEQVTYICAPGRCGKNNPC